MPRKLAAVASLTTFLSFWLVNYQAVQAAQPPADRPFNRLDRDGDGKLSPEEVPPAIRQFFGRIDRDQNGFLTREEFQSARAVLQGGASGAGPRIPESIRAELDIPYAGTDHPRQRLDLLIPQKPQTADPLPVIVAIHGGAWRGGDKRQVIGRLIPLVASGQYAGVSVGYRLSQDAVWPAQIHDCKAAIRWIRGNAPKYNLDPKKIGVIGWSAGGHLVAMLGTAGDVAELEGELGDYRDQSSRVTCVVDFFGPANLLTIGRQPSQLQHDNADSPQGLLLGAAIHAVREKARSASPITYVTADDPPFLIVHGTQDMVVPFAQSTELRDALRAAGVAGAMITVENGGHGGFRNPEIDRRVEAFFDWHLRGVKASFQDETLPNEAP